MLNPKEEAKFKELKDKCRELKVPAPPEIFIGLQVHDKNGVLVFDDKQRGHSWTRNYWGLLYMFGSGIATGNSASFGAGYMSNKQTNGTVTYNSAGAIGTNTTYIGVASITSTDNGIVVGTGDTAFSVNQYGLAALIGSGNGAGQLAYSAQTVGVCSYTGGSKTWSTPQTRVFNNNSGGSITVKETGLCMTQNFWSASGKFMLERSVLSPTVAVANGAQLTVTYEISMDFSAID